MSLLLKKQGVKPDFGENVNSENIYGANRNQQEEQLVMFSVPLISNPAGNNTRVELTWSTQELYKIDGLFMEWEIANSSATEAPTFMHCFASYFQDMKCLINNNEVLFHKDRFSLKCAFENSLRLYDESQIYQRLQSTRTELGKTLVGETVPVSSSLFVSTDLFMVYPFLKGFIPNLGGIQRLTFEINFSYNSSSLLNGTFVKSNTTSNAYGSNLTYKSIRVRQCQSKHTDARMFKNVFPVNYLLDKFETKVYSMDFTVGVAPLNVDLNLAFSKHKKIVGLYVFGQRPSDISAYNDSDAGKYFSGSTYFTYRILSKSKEILKHDSITENKKDRVRYALEAQRKRWGCELPFEVLTLSTDLGRIYITETFIDLTGLYVDKVDEFIVAGYDNSVERDIEIELNPAQTVGANTNVYVVAQYEEIMQIDPKSGFVKILS